MSIICTSLRAYSYKQCLLYKVDILKFVYLFWESIIFQKSTIYPTLFLNNINGNKLTATSTDVTQEVNKILPEKLGLPPSWRPTPSTDKSNLLGHYLKLSKFRLTSLYVLFQKTLKYLS